MVGDRHVRLGGRCSPIATWHRTLSQADGTLRSGSILLHLERPRRMCMIEACAYPILQRLRHCCDACASSLVLRAIFAVCIQEGVLRLATHCRYDLRWLSQRQRLHIGLFCEPNWLPRPCTMQQSNARLGFRSSYAQLQQLACKLLARGIP